ncbi:hypothetical protein GCM10009759_43260 [Kitasatospora saccharophila]|uniref:Uncharacterized protein n=1 Tax=Kitasatospora saccharophila TaxID=407973 RepID=A0ABN2X960_9ACTN
MNRWAVRPPARDPPPPAVRRNPRNPPRSAAEPAPERHGAPARQRPDGGSAGKRGQLAVDAEPEELLEPLVEDDGVEDPVEVEEDEAVEEDEPLTELLELERLSVR